MTAVRNLLLRFFDLKAEESNKFFLLFFHSFSLGITISFHFVPANSIFIEHFGSDQLPYAYLASGAFGYVITQIYSALQKKVSPDALFRAALWFLWFMLSLQVAGQYFFNEKWLSFFVFISAAPLFTVIALQQGGLAMKLLNLRQMKRLFGLINIGGIVAAILSYLILIPIIINYIGTPFNLIYFSIAGVTAALFLLMRIGSQFKEDHTRQKEGGVSEKKSMSWKELFQEKYFSLIFYVAAISTLVIFFNDFFYLASIKAQDTLLDSPAKVSQFIAIVSAIFKIGELLGSYFANRFLSRYGMRLGLTLLPYVSTTLILLATPFGLIFGSGSLFFFALVVSNKILDRTLRQSVGEISFNILYQPLPNKHKLEIQTRVGVVIQVASGSVGLLLVVLTSLLTTEDGFQLKYFSLFFLPLLVLWLWLTRQLFNAYRKKLKQILTDISRNTKRDIYKLSYGIEILTKKFKQFNKKVVKLSVMIVSETNPKALERYAPTLLKSDDSTVARAILRNIDPTWRQRLASGISKFSKKNNDDELTKMADRAVFRLTNAIDDQTDLKQLKEWIDSQEISNQIKAIQYIQANKFKDSEKYILTLMRSDDKIVKSAAISLATLAKTRSIIEELIVLLRNEEYHHISADILLQIGDTSIEYLQKLFEEPEISALLLVQVVEILAKIGTTQAKQAMVKHMNYPNRDVQKAIIGGLYFCRYQVNATEVKAVRNKLEETIENILWIYASILDLENQKNTLKIYQAMDEEREVNFDILFKILSFLYEPRIINLIRKNIVGQNTIFALEIIDNFIAQDIKQLIIPIFDEISVNQKLKKFQAIFPQERLSLTDRLRQVVIRDYNKLDIWTVSKAIELLGKLHKKKQSKTIKALQQTDETQGLTVWTTKKVKKLLIQIRKSEMPDEVVAALYHPHELVYNMAARVLYEENPSRCYDYLRKLPEKYESLHGLLEGGSTEKEQFLSERIRILKRHPHFFSVPENFLVRLAQLFEIVHLAKDEKIFLKKNDNKTEYIFIVMKGELIYGQENEPEIFEKNSFVTGGLNISEAAEFLTAARASVALRADRYQYFNLLVTQTELIQHIFDRIQSNSELHGDDEQPDE